MMRVNTAWHVHRRERGGARVELEQTDVHLLRSSTERSVVFRTMSELRDQEDGRATDGTRGKAGTKRRPTEDSLARWGHSDSVRPLQGEKIAKRWSTIKKIDPVYAHDSHAYVENTCSIARRNLYDFKRLKDFNLEPHSGCAAVCVNFHHENELALCATAGGVLNLFRVDGIVNGLLQSTSFSNLSIIASNFSRMNDNVIVCGKESLLFWDLASGRIEKSYFPDSIDIQGDFVQADSTDLLGVIGSRGVGIFSQKSRTCVMNLKMNAPVRACIFNSFDREVMCSVADGKLYCWDVRMQRCLKVAKGFDGVTRMCKSSDDAMLITGLENGVINVYDVRKLAWDTIIKEEQKVEKSVSTLRTSITSMSTGPHFDFIVASSSLERNALKIIHLPSLSVLNTWPTSSTPLHYVTSHAINRDGTVLAVANARGRVLTYGVSTRC